MQFDGEISTEVSLSRILDEMLIDGTSKEIVLKFLSQHETDISDIFRDSAFAYDLYDITLRDEDLDPLLLKHMEHLRPIDCFFAMKQYAASHGNKSIHAFPELEAAIQNVRQESIFMAEDKWGKKIPWEVLNGEVAIWDYVNAMNDVRDVSSFLRSSYLSRSIFVAKNFLRLCPTAQFYVLSQTPKECNGTWGTREAVKARVSAYLVLSLVRQVLSTGDVETFNWIVNVAGLLNRSRYFSGKVIDEILMRIRQKSIRDMISPPSWTMPMSAFEEIVFEVNMFGGQVDGMDVFLAIYLGGGKSQLKGMKENRDLFEFLSLPFDPSETEMMKDEKGNC